MVCLLALLPHQWIWISRCARSSFWVGSFVVYRWDPGTTWFSPLCCSWLECLPVYQLNSMLQISNLGMKLSSKAKPQQNNSQQGWIYYVIVCLNHKERRHNSVVWFRRLGWGSGWIRGSVVFLYGNGEYWKTRTGTLQHIAVLVFSWGVGMGMILTEFRRRPPGLLRLTL